MKDIQPKLIGLFKEGYCTPQIAKIALKLREPSTTIHYNIKKLESEGKIKTYKAVFDYSKIGEGFCAYILVKLSPDEYGNPEKVGNQLAAYDKIESVDIITGDYEMIVKARVKDQDEYYAFVKKIASTPGVTKTFTLLSFKQIKTEFVEL
jgi:DNA-binding Lrp family transcriptional regulator